MVMRGSNSKDLSLCTDLSLTWSLGSVPLLFSSISLKIGGKKTPVLQGFSGCIVNSCYTPRDPLTKDAVEVVVLLWGFFVCFLKSVFFPI